MLCPWVYFRIHKPTYKTRKVWFPQRSRISEDMVENDSSWQSNRVETYRCMWGTFNEDDVIKHDDTHEDRPVNNYYCCYSDKLSLKKGRCRRYFLALHLILQSQWSKERARKTVSGNKKSWEWIINEKKMDGIIRISSHLRQNLRSKITDKKISIRFTDSNVCLYVLSDLFNVAPQVLFSISIDSSMNVSVFKNNIKIE